MKYIRDRIRSIFQLKDSAHKLAASFALGVFIAFSPTVGLHMISCILLAWVFRLNKLVVFSAAFINNPWTMVPMYGFSLWFGMKITGSHFALPAIAWKEIGLADLFRILKPYLLPFVAGTVVLGVISAIISYFIIYWAISQYRRSQAE